MLTDRRQATVDVTIPTPAGGMPGYLSRPADTGRWPGVVVLHDGFGIDDAVRVSSGYPMAIRSAVVLSVLSEGGDEDGLDGVQAVLGLVEDDAGA